MWVESTFALRRVVASVLAQPARPSFSVRPSSRSASLHFAKPVAQRSFHASRRWLVDAEQSKAAEEAGASRAEAQIAGIDALEPSADEQKQEIREESVVAPGVADAAQNQSRGPIARVTDAVSRAADSVSSAVAFAPRSPRLGESANSSGKILYIGNLFFEVTAKELEAEFAQYGTIVNSRVVTDYRGQSKGFGFIEFENAEDGEQAIRGSDQKVFQGRRMAVQVHQPRERTASASSSQSNADMGPSPPSKTLFIGNMSYQMSDRDLNDLFREVRNVLDVRVAIDRRSGQPRGFAHADFTDVDSATKAKELLSQKVVYGRQIRVDFSRTHQQQATRSNE